MSNISKRRREGSRAKIKSMGDHREFLKRITKTLYYGELPSLPCLSLPVTEISCALWSEAQRGRSLRRLHADAAARIARDACVSPCALVLAILYLERLHRCNPDYLANAQPAELFLVSLMVGNKFLQDDGEDEEVVSSEWAAAGRLPSRRLHRIEIDFLNAIDWNVYVDEETFETKLSWLERQVALKQAAARGFFTYTDLAALGEGAAPGALAAAAAAAALAAAAVALLASALLVSHVYLPALQYLTRTTAVAPSSQPELDYLGNATIDLSSFNIDEPKCCPDWLKYRKTVESEKKWYDSVIVYDWKAFEPSALSWLYQSSLVNPLQRWLERINQYAELFKAPVKSGKCYEHVPRDSQPQCVRQWLNFSKLSALVVSVSDR